jgi:4-amino-4-deoxy-L-arabinose transferase-like glycosyltransferase
VTGTPVSGRVAALRTSIESAAARTTYGRSLALITLAGALVRLATMSRQPLGYDEDFTAVVVHQPLARMIDIIGRDSAPPLFYLLEHAIGAAAEALGLAALGGPGGPVALRLLPTLAGIALIPLIAALARRIGGDSAALWAALFAALAPTTVLLSGFARMYSPATLLTLASALLLLRAVERPSAGRWITYFAAAASAVWMDYFSAVALAGILIAAVWLRPGRRTLAVAALTTILAIASIAPWLVVARAQLEHSGQGFWVPPLSPAMIGGTLSQLFMGPPIDNGVPFSPALIALQDVTVVAGFAALAFAFVVRGRLDDGGRRAAAYCLLASSGVALLVAVSLARPLLDARYATVMWLPLYAVAGAALAAMPRRAATGIVAIVAVTTLSLSVATTHNQTSLLVADLDARVGQHDLAAASWDHYLILLDESGPSVQPRLHVLSPDDPPWFVGTAAYPAGAVIHEVPPDVAANGGLVFWVSDPGLAPSGLPPGYHSLESRCVILACLTVYGP